jgi:hypothetical protein
MRRHLHELRARAENIGATTLKRVETLPGEAVAKLAVGSRAPVQNLAKGLAEWARKMEPAKPKAVEAAPEAKPEPKVAKAS